MLFLLNPTTKNCVLTLKKSNHNVIAKPVLYLVSFKRQMQTHRRWRLLLCLTKFLLGRKQMTTEFLQIFNWNSNHLHFPLTVAQKWRSSTSWSRSFPPLFYDGPQKKKKNKKRKERKKIRVGGGPSFISAHPSPIHRATKVINHKCY